MTSVKLEIVDTTSRGSYHVRLLINNSDCGILYLDDKEPVALNNVFSSSEDDMGYTFTGAYTDDEH